MQIDDNAVADLPPRDHLEEYLRPGAPKWITPGLITTTLDCWQPHFAKALTIQDAIDILKRVGSLMDILRSCNKMK
jgi:hypothetical protein